ncbi:thioredoxin family protein [Calycomorphotria hydatis]|uniref:Thiol:disulfide interchange protein n=1 Tax=Calycomorphotria hydatis TaxID=2528027 RepID=A0A517TDI7_9PLAN|nr:thioredoxin family protein [Calycomorphotria hydatis]QDT66432.1 thiol:disulfide interchange protein precursor [Calycomorphotria hydatis]
MSRLKFAAIAVCCTLFTSIALSHFAMGDQPQGPVAWQKDLYTAHSLSVQSNKPVLVVFGAEWCRFCKKLEGNTLSNPVMAGYVNENFVPVHLDFDQDKKIAQILEVKSIPCTVILSPKADLLGRVVGFKEPKDFWENLEDARELQSKILPAGHTVPAAE